MDLQQRKLNKAEWESIEVPVNQEELEVLQLIQKGYHDVNVCYNKTESLFTFLKIDVTPEMEDYLYHKYFADNVKGIVNAYQMPWCNVDVNARPTIKKIDMMRLEKNTMEVVERAPLFEHVLFAHLQTLLQERKRKPNEAGWMKHYVTLYHLVRSHVLHVNRHAIAIVKKVLEQWAEEVKIPAILENAVDFLEKNDCLTTYADQMLYTHQKEIFTVCKTPDPKLVLYIAPTGTGKTLSPIGLSESHRVIFVCAARHVGLALARAAISCNKKVAFAFGCASSGDIRLHYFAAKEATINRRTGGIWKVDNSVGDKVEIMICDIKSYLSAMFYMLAFNADHEIITYWDEPTITLDYANHEFHEMIQRNWRENKIPNMVLSSATLPKLHELGATIADFKGKFPMASIHNIVSHDCKKSIPLIDKNGFVVLPHLLSEDVGQVVTMAQHCENHPTLLRYFDLGGVVDFIHQVEKRGGITRKLSMDRHFETLGDVAPLAIKLYYLHLLRHMDTSLWPALSAHFKENPLCKLVENETIDPKGNKIKKAVSIGPGSVPPSYSSQPITRMASLPVGSSTYGSSSTGFPSTPPKSGGTIYVTTKDSYTLTDGPTIFLANDVEKVAKFCIQQANIPAIMMESIVEKINYNNQVNARIEELEKAMEDYNERKENKNAESSSSTDKKKIHKLDRSLGDQSSNVEYKKLYAELETMRSMIKVTKLNDAFVPNTITHLNKWAETLNTKAAFKSDIDDDIIVEIMMLKNVADSWKVLLLMGIGVFTNHESIRYTEIMKKLADSQKLYLIIASSDYIYGTNYSFCHAYLSKDLNLTQEKIIQAMGRVGRNKMQQDYTIRFRDDEQIQKIFTEEVDKPEVINMNRLFCSHL